LKKPKVQRCAMDFNHWVRRETCGPPELERNCSKA